MRAATLLLGLMSCTYEVKDLATDVTPSVGSSTVGSGGKPGGATAAAAGGAPGEAGHGAGGSGGAGGGGGGGAAWTSCKAVGYYGLCVGAQQDVVIYFYDVPPEVQIGCGVSATPSPHCLVRNCVAEMAGTCGTTPCGDMVNDGKTCLGNPRDTTFLKRCYQEPPQCIGNVAVRPSGDGADCDFRDCEAEGLTCSIAGGDVDCA